MPSEPSRLRIVTSRKPRVSPEHVRKRETIMAKILAVIYGVVSHLMFLLVFLYLICFLGNFDSLVAKTIDSGTPGPFG